MVRICLLKSSSNFSETNILFQLLQTNSIVFLIASVLVLVKQYFGTPIDCIYDGILEQHKSFVNSYCWRNYEPMVPQESLIPFTDVQAFNRSMLIKKHSGFFRWLPLILLFQAILAYIPSWLWNVLRDRRLYETMKSIKDPLKQHSRKKLVIINLANDLFTEVIQKRYAKPFFFCEILNIICFTLNMLSVNLLFQNYFFMYGFRETGMRFQTSTESTSNLEYSEMFPSFGKCSVQVAKRGYGIKKEEAICMISFNSLCESIFMFLWVWFCILIVATLIGATYRIFMTLSRRKRKKLLMECVDNTFEDKISIICKKLGFYSWFTLYRISRNVDPLTFQDIIFSLMVKLDSLPMHKTAKTTTSENGKHDSALVKSQNSVTVTVV